VGAVGIGIPQLGPGRLELEIQGVEGERKQTVSVNKTNQKKG